MTTNPTQKKTQILAAMMPLLFWFNSFLPNFNPYLGLSVNNFNNRSCKSNQVHFNAKSYRIKTVVIDAGHGGKDSGCLGEYTLEKDIVLSLSKQLAARMRQAYPNIKVVLTRKDDTFVELYKRAEIANKLNADLFISIHCNAGNGSRQAHGTETFVMGLHTAEQNLSVVKRENASIYLEDNIEENYPFDPNSTEGHIFASLLQNDHLDKSILFARQIEEQFQRQERRKSRGVKQAGFVVLKLTTMPSVLVEAGFLTNPKEEAYLSTPFGQNRVVQSIFTAFGNYKATLEQAEQGKIPMAYTDKSAANNLNPRKTDMRYTRPKGENNQPKIVTRAKVRPQLPPTSRTKTTAIASTVPDPNANYTFRIQLAVSKEIMDVGEAKWKGFDDPVEVIRSGEFYKYQTGNFKSLEKAERAKMKIQLTKFPDAFIVAYKNGTSISLADAKKQLGLR